MRVVIALVVGFALLLPAFATAQDRPRGEVPQLVVLDQPDPASQVTPSPAASTPEPGFGGLPRGNKNSAEGMGEMPGGGGGMGGGGPPGYAATWYPNVEGFGLVRQSLNAGVPVWRGEQGNMLLATVGVRNTLFFTDRLLPESNRPFPNQLWNLSLGSTYIHRFENGWSAILIGGIGSASDKPFNSLREMTANLGVMVRIPAANGRDSWTVGAFYMAGGPLNFPIPILAYTWNATEKLRLNLGLPFSVNWRPTEEWEFNASYLPLLNVNARVTYKPIPLPGVQFFAGYEFLNEAFFLADRAVQLDRFFLFEQRILAGVRYDLTQRFTVEANAGYAFGRSVGEGQNQWGTLRDRVDLPAGPFIGARLSLRF